jgi:arginase
MKSLNLIGLPFNYGQSQDGVSKSASYLRAQGLVKRLSRYFDVHDMGDLSLRWSRQDCLQDGIIDPQANFQANHLISQYISRSASRDFQLNIGGDHGVGLGTVHAALQKDPSTVIIWADAHGDVNTPLTSPSGNFHGMPLAYLLGEANHAQYSWSKVKLAPEKLILIGPRDLDQGEREIITKRGVQFYSSRDLNRIGAEGIMATALNRADPQKKAPIHLSFDVDLFDASDVASTGTRVHEGPRTDEVFSLCSWIARTNRLKSMDLVEFNPELGNSLELKKSTELILDLLEIMAEEMALNPMSLEYFQQFRLSQLWEESSLKWSEC